MAKKFKDLVAKMSAGSQARIQERTAQMAAEMALQELRQAMQLTQEQMADELQMNQAAISKMERQSDMYVSTLRRFIAAMGGELRIVAHFPQADVVISNRFEDIRNSPCTRLDHSSHVNLNADRMRKLSISRVPDGQAKRLFYWHGIYYLPTPGVGGAGCQVAGLLAAAVVESMRWRASAPASGVVGQGARSA